MLKKSELIKKALVCFNNQKRRCYTKTNPRYKDNGAKGIRVLYSKNEFIDWFVQNYKTFNGQRTSVGRIDHSKSYSIDNIRFESLAENSLERIKRVGPTKPRIKILILDADTMEPIFVANSTFEASDLTGIQKSHISKYCTGKLKKSKRGYTLRYADDIDMDKIQSL